MEITPQLSQGAQLIESYGNGGFKIAGVRYDHSVMVFASQTAEWNKTSEGAISEEDISCVMALEETPEVLLIGMGESFLPLKSALRNKLRAKGIGADVMDTGAACRTFNILLAEGRKVVALLVAV